MPIPDYQSLMLPVLRLAADRKAHSLAQIRECIASELQLPDDELAERLASDSQTVFANRIAWAVGRPHWKPLQKDPTLTPSVLSAGPTNR